LNDNRKKLFNDLFTFDALLFVISNKLIPFFLLQQFFDFFDAPLAKNSGHEPAVGVRFRNKMSVNMATDFIKKCMQGM